VFLICGSRIGWPRKWIFYFAKYEIRAKVNFISQNFVMNLSKNVHGISYNFHWWWLISKKSLKAVPTSLDNVWGKFDEGFKVSRNEFLSVNSSKHYSFEQFKCENLARSSYCLNTVQSGSPAAQTVPIRCPGRLSTRVVAK
jgi:hypothetical protein